MLDIAIVNGELVLPAGRVRQDLGIKEEKIVSIGDLKGTPSKRYINASRYLVFPGFIDPHVHFHDDDPQTKLSAPDEIYPLTRAAAFGGNTTLMDFAFPGRGISPLDSFLKRRQMTDGKVAVDYLLHMAVFSDDPDSLKAISEAKRFGMRSIKLILMRPPMTDDTVLRKTLRAALENKVVVMVHAEDALILQDGLKRQVHNGKIAVSDFPLANPRMAELESVNRCIRLAAETGSSIYVCHISSREAINVISKARQNGLPIIGETTPHYLLLTESVYSKPEGAVFVCSPPIRKYSDMQELWNGLRDGTLRTIGSDHCGFTKCQKMSSANDFRNIPKGIAGVETRGVVIFSEGVAKGRITIDTFINLVSTNPAKIYGLYPKKGALALGSDADICIFDPEHEWTITSDSLHFDWGYSPHEGLRVKGKPVITILRGKVIVESDQYLGSQGDGTNVGGY